MLNESFAQARTVRAYRLEAPETIRAESAFAQLYRALMRMAKGRARVDPVLEVLGGARGRRGDRLRRLARRRSARRRSATSPASSPRC